MTTTEVPRPGLSPEPIIIIIPDSPADLFPIEESDPTEFALAPVSTPLKALEAVPLPSSASKGNTTIVVSRADQRIAQIQADLAAGVVEPERLRITDTEWFWFGVLGAKYACITGIVGIIGYYVLYPIYLGAALVLTLTGASAVLAGPLLLTAMLVAGIWRLAGRVSGATISKPVTRLVTTDKTAASPRTRARKATTVVSEACRDVLTDRWVAAMRDPQNRQAHGALDGYVTVDADGICVGDPDSHCADGWLLEVNGDKNFRRATKAMERKYGVPLLRQVARLNDQGMPLPEIADYVERHHRKGMPR